MTPDRRDDSVLDAAIDRAVRDLMSAEPRADLRARVMAELASEPARAAWWPRLAVGSAAVAAAVVILLTIVSRPADRPIDQTVAGAPPPASSKQSDTARPSVSATPAAAGGSEIRDSQTTAVARRGGAEDRLVQAASIAPVDALGIEPMTTVERLRPLEPIGITELEAPLVAAPAISIPLITIEPIEITPLTPPR